MSDEESYRAQLDADFILRADAALTLARGDAFTVFAQRQDAFLDAPSLTRQARQFFATDLGLTVEKRYTKPLPRVDAARIVVATKDENGTRLAYGRPRTEDDLRAADEAEARVGYAGLALLAKRCSTVWIVQPIESGAGDRIALRIAAILASVLLGPILSPHGDALFGVKTARIKLDQPRAT